MVITKINVKKGNFNLLNSNDIKYSINIKGITGFEEDYVNLTLELEYEYIIESLKTAYTLEEIKNSVIDLCNNCVRYCGSGTNEQFRDKIKDNEDFSCADFKDIIKKRCEYIIEKYSKKIEEAKQELSILSKQEVVKK